MQQSLRAFSAGMRPLAIVALFLGVMVSAAPTAEADVKGKLAEVGLPSGSLGGQLNAPQGIAVNRSGAGGVTAGDFYVADRLNHRIQQFSLSGAFVRAFGLDVVLSGPGNVTPANAVQSVSVPASVTAGIFRLSFNGQSTGGTGTGTLTEGSNTVTSLIAAKGTAETTANSPLVTGLSTTVGKFIVGQAVSGTGIPAGTTIINASASALTLSSNATASGSGVTISSIGPRPFAAGQVILGAGIPAGTTITAVNAAEGKLTLSANVEAGGTGAEVPLRSGLAYDATAAQVQTALQGLSTIGSGAATVAGGPGASNPYTVTFGGALANLPVSLLGADSGELTGGSVAASVTTPGKSAFEICEAGGADTCKIGLNQTVAGGLQQIMSVAVDQATGNIYATGNQARRVDVFSAKGAYQGSFGFGVRVGDTAPFGLDFCTFSTGCIVSTGTIPTGSAAAGGLTSSAASRTLDVDSAGNLYVPDPGNKRLAVYAPVLNGSNEVVGANFVRAIGGDVIPSGAQGTGTVTAGSTSISSVSTTKKAFREGQIITGVGIAPNTIITAVASTSLTLSQAATSAATGPGTALTVAEGTGNVPQNEKQTITLPVGTTDGTFTLTFKVAKPSESEATTATIPFDATAAEVEASLGSLSNLGASNVAVSGDPGGPYIVEFKGTRFADTNVEPMTGSGISLAPAGSVGISTTQDGTAQEACTVASTCQAGAAGPAPGWFNTESPNSVAVDAGGSIYTVSFKGSTTAVCEAGAPCRVQKFNPEGTISNAAFGPTSGPCQVSYSSGNSNELEARAVAVDPSNQHLFVLKKTAAAGARVCELDNNGAFDGESLSPPLPGLTVESNNAGPGLAVGLLGRVYAANRTPALYILGSVPSPGVEILPPTDITATGAKLNGIVTVPPGTEGIEAKYHFEYSEDGSNWISAPVPDASVGADPGSFPVEQEISGLAPSTQYLVKLVARTSASVSSAQLTFKTLAAAPGVSLTYAEEITQTSADLGAHINPGGISTAYYFEWGPTALYGNKVPLKDRSIGEGKKDVIATESLTGLTPETTYHFRVVVKNGVEEVQGPDQEFETLNACGLTDKRCYELVSPADKGPVAEAGELVALGQDLQFQVARQGSKLAYTMGYGLLDATSSNEILQEAERTATGWRSHQMPPALEAPPSSDATSTINMWTKGLSPDLSCGVVTAVQRLTADAPARTIEEGGSLLYRRAADGTYTLITKQVPRNVGGRLPHLDYDLIGMSDDCQRVVFATHYVYSGSDQDGVNQKSLYEWNEGQLKDVGQIPGPSGLMPAPVTAGAFSGYNAWRAVSQEGDVRRVVFTASRVATGQPGELAGEIGRRAVMLREDDGTTVDVIDVSRSTTSTPSRGARYQTASKDGSKVFFVANYGLTPLSLAETGAGSSECDGSGVDGCDLYVYDGDAAPGARLTDLSVSPEGAGVAGVLGASDDGAYVYFAARGKVGGVGRSRLENQSADTVNVFLSSPDGVRYVAPVRNRDVQGPPSAVSITGVLVDSSTKLGEDASWSSRVSEDGRHLLFQSTANVTGYDNEDAIMVYRYSAESDETVCVSCRRDGLPTKQLPVGITTPVDRPLSTGAAGETSNVLNPPVAMSEEGDRVFFFSRDRLAVGAREDERNLYQWENGQISLVGAPVAGLKTRPLRFVGASVSGDDVFFVTAQPLSPHDVDGRKDVYDARVGGGFAPPIPSDPVCDPLTESACQGAGTAAPTPPPIPGSSAFTGPGNEPAKKPKCRKGTVRKHGKCVPKGKNEKAKSGKKKAGKANRGAK